MINVYDIPTIDILETPSFAWRETLQSAIDEVGQSNFVILPDTDQTEYEVNDITYRVFFTNIVSSEFLPGFPEEQTLTDLFWYLLILQPVIPIRAIGEDWKGDLTIQFGFCQD